jgi:hypothetical protein
VIVFNQERAVGLSHDASVLQFKVLIARSQEGKRQMFCSANCGYGLTYNKLSTAAITIKDCQPRMLENDLGKPNQGAYAHTQNYERCGPTRHAGCGCNEMLDRVKQKSSNETTQHAANKAIACFACRSFINSVGYTNAHPNDCPANCSGKSHGIKEELANNTPRGSTGRAAD